MSVILAVMAQGHRKAALRAWRQAWLARLETELDEAALLTEVLAAQDAAALALACEIVELRAMVTALSTAHAT